MRQSTIPASVLASLASVNRPTDVTVHDFYSAITADQR